MMDGSLINCASINTRTALSIVKELRNYFQRHEIDVLHTHKYKDNILGTLAAVPRELPYLVRTIHGSPEPFVGLPAWKMSSYQMLDRLMNRWAVDRIVAVSSALRDSLIARFGRDKVICIHNAIDVGHIRPSGNPLDLRAKLGLSEHEFVIGTIGRLAPVKGLELFLGAARIISYGFIMSNPQRVSHVPRRVLAHRLS